MLYKQRTTVPSSTTTVAAPARDPKITYTFKQKLAIFITLVGSMTGAALISLYVLIHQSLRLDESQTIWQASHSFAGTLERVALDVHVPLYHTIVHFWMFAFGDSQVTVRLLSLIFFLVTIPIIFLIARRLLPLRWALFAVMLFSFSPFMTWYASEARMYTLLVLFASLNLYFFMKIARTGHGWIGFTLSAMIGAYSHYFFMFTLLTEGLYFLLTRKSFAKGSFKKFVAVAIAVLAGLSPWLYYFRSLGSASDTRPMLAVPSSVDFSNIFSQFIFGYQTDATNTILLSSWPLIMLLSLIAVRRRANKTQQVALIGAMAVVPVILAFVVSLIITPFFLSRYMVSCVAPLLIFIVWLISQYKPVFARLAVVILVAITAISSYQQASSPNTPIKEEYYAATQFINKNVKPQDLVVISAPFTIYPIEYYYTGSAQIQTLPYWNRTAAGSIPAFDADKLPQQVEDYNKNHRYIYLVLSQDQGYEDEVYQYYLQRFKQVSKQHFSDDLNVYVYQVGYYTVPPLDQATEPVQ